MLDGDIYLVLNDGPVFGVLVGRASKAEVRRVMNTILRRRRRRR